MFIQHNLSPNQACFLKGLLKAFYQIHAQQNYLIHSSSFSMHLYKKRMTHSDAHKFYVHSVTMLKSK